jgi:acyl-CoA reductase-like NAD-dependent aldehyde dehydrogenase
MGEKQLDDIITKAFNAQQQWSRVPLSNRVDVAHQLLTKLDDNSLSLAVMITEAMGKPIT